MRISDWSSDVCSSDLAASLTVIDVKATRRATAFHKTQVAFYVRVLEELLRELKLTSSEVTTINPFGEIWRIPDEGTAEGDDWQIEQFALRSEEHTSELQSLMRISYAVFCLKKK